MIGFNYARDNASAMRKIDDIILSAPRKLLVAKVDVALDAPEANTIFVLIVQESRGSAGGRAAGSGSRKIDRIHGFDLHGDVCEEFFYTSTPETIDRFDIPYSAVAMDIRLSDGSGYVAQGVLDPDLVSLYLRIVAESKTE